MMSLTGPKHRQTGDRAELSNLPESLSFWRHIDARSETCLGQKCTDFDACFITRMRERALDADIVVVNHHLFFADLALRNSNYGSVLPDYTAVILDEAHLIEDVASEYFGSQVSNYQIDDLIRDVGAIPYEEAEADREITKTSARVMRFADNFWMGFRAGRGEEGRYAILPNSFAKRDEDGDLQSTPLGELYIALDGALGRLETTLDALKEKPPEVENLVRRIRQTKFDLQFIVTGADKKFVYWTERRGRGLFLRASPIDVSGLLEDKLFEKVDTVVLTSATLSSAGNFSFHPRAFGSELGVGLDCGINLRLPNSGALVFAVKDARPALARMGRGGGDGSNQDCERNGRPRVRAFHQPCGDAVALRSG